MCPSTGPVTYGERESRKNRGFVSLDAAGEGEELPNRGGPYIFEPAIESLTAVVANEVQEAVGQLSCLCKCAIHLTETIQLLLRFRSQRLRAGDYPPDYLSWGHVLQRKVSNESNRSGRSALTRALSPFA